MHIAIDASRTTVTKRTGTEYYATRMIQALLALPSDHRFTLYFREAPPPHLFPAAPNLQTRVLAMPRLWTHLAFAAAISRARPDVTFVPAHTLPYWFGGRAVVTVHDVGYRHFPQAHPPRQRWYLDWSTAHSVRRAAAVLADSEATAADVRLFYGAADKLHIVPPAIDPQAQATADQIAAVRAKYHLPEMYFLFVGTLQPRKNIAGLVKAYARYRARHMPLLPRDRHELAGLVLAGAQGWLYDPSWIAGVEGITVTGYIDEADKAALYAGALALVFPSLYEGFGFPVLEAMQQGTPVLASNNASLPELVSSAGLLFRADDHEAFAAAMGVLQWDDRLRYRLRDKGLVRAQAYTWEHSARLALAVLEKVGYGTVR
jgi:glycosyltransferase involved in cell wall biosynthesis